MLTFAEKQATILDLLRARSGIYHDAARETPLIRARRPIRGSHPPGSFYYPKNGSLKASAVSQCVQVLDNERPAPRAPQRYPTATHPIDSDPSESQVRVTAL